MLLLSLIYYLGMASCGVQGAEKSKGNIECVICSAFFSSFGGGLVRDIILLKIWPAVFKYESLPDVITALFSAMLYRTSLHNKRINNYLKNFSFFSDAIGLSQFICIGVDKALNNECPFHIVLLCGITTALGGGILSSLFSGYSIKAAIFSHPTYKIITIEGTLLYIYFLFIGVEQYSAQVYLALFTLTAIVLDKSFDVKKIDMKAMHIIHNIQRFNIIALLFPFTQSLKYLTSFIYNYIVIYSYDIVSRQHSKKLILHNKKKINILFHRIRQM